MTAGELQEAVNLMHCIVFLVCGLLWMAMNKWEFGYMLLNVILGTICIFLPKAPSNILFCWAFFLTCIAFGILFAIVTAKSYMDFARCNTIDSKRGQPWFDQDGGMHQE